MGDVGPRDFTSPINLSCAALPLADQLVVIAPDGMVVVLDSSGRRLWEALETGCTVDDLVDACVQYGDFAEDAAGDHIAQVLESWRELGLIQAEAPQPKPEPLATSGMARLPEWGLKLDRVYMPGDCPVRVRCDDRVLAGVIEAACRSCRVEAAASAQTTVDVIEQDGWFAVQADDAMLARTAELTQNRALARHRCLTALLETARPSRRWLGILHASAVSAAGRCAVFCGAKGSGKSTLAAALVAAGADFVTDDYAPLEQASWLVWPVPYAPGIKRGSWRSLGRRYPDLHARPVHQLAGLHIRYLELDVRRMAALNRGLPVGALIFPRYQAGAGLEQHEMTPADALVQLCHARSMLDRDPDRFAETVRWLESVPACRLVYGDLDRAVERLLTMLDGQ
jgi:Coenzyme PQQ synthesis protein D (PqqD)